MSFPDPTWQGWCEARNDPLLVSHMRRIEVIFTELPETHTHAELIDWLERLRVECVLTRAAVRADPTYRRGGR